MLGKLITHEFKAVSKILAILHLAILIITIIGVIAINFNSSDNDSLQMISSLTLVMYILILIAVAVAVLIFIVVRFYRNLFTDEGYLMNTLPVKPYELILSKLIVGFIWCIINGICTIVSISLLTLSQFSLADLSAGWDEIAQALFVEAGISVGSLIPYIIFGSIISVIYMLIMFYASIAIGQTFKNHKVLFSLGAYIVLYMLSQIVSTIALIPFGFATMINSDTTNFETLFSPMMLISYVASLALILLYFLLTNYLVSKKLNLE